MFVSDDLLSPLRLPVSELFLDIFNPRFSGEEFALNFGPSDKIGNFRNQELTRRLLLEKYSVRPLIESMCRLGFLPLDRIVVQEFSKEQYVVVEGNRRLAAIKTILGDVQRCVLDLPRHILQTMESIEVLRIANDSVPFDQAKLLLQGVRHISGVKNWGPYQQGKLIHSLVDNDGMNFSEAALAVGLSPSRVSTLVRSYYGLRQMQSDAEFSSFANVNLFSGFEQAYVKLPVRNWLCWSEDKKGYTDRNALKFFYKQISHEEGGPKILAREIRDLLPAVLEHEEAKVAYLEGRVSLREAYLITQPHKEYLEPFLKSASGLMKRFQEGIQQSDLNVEDRALLEKVHLFTGKILQKQSV